MSYAYAHAAAAAEAEWPEAGTTPPGWPAWWSIGPPWPPGWESDDVGVYQGETITFADEVTATGSATRAIYSDRCAMIDGENVITNYATEAEVGTSLAPSYSHHTVLHFDLSSITPAASVVSAYLHMYQASGGAWTGFIFRLRRTWVENTVTWRSPWDADGASNTSTDYYPSSSGSIVFSGAAGSYTSTDLEAIGGGTNLVEKWIVDEEPNYGMILKPSGVAGTPYAVLDGRGDANEPYLVVNYTF